MSKIEQIEEMASIIHSKVNGANFDDVSDAVVALYTAGYRKSTDVAEEIFAEIEKLKHTKWDWNDYVDWDAIAELKKKYIVTDTNVGCKTEEGK